MVRKDENTEMISDEKQDHDLECYQGHIIDVTEQHLGALEMLYEQKKDPAIFIYEMELQIEFLLDALESMTELTAHANIKPITYHSARFDGRYFSTM